MILEKENWSRRKTGKKRGMYSKTLLGQSIVENVVPS